MGAATMRNRIIPARVADRAANRYCKDGDCWITRYYVSPQNGYGAIQWKEGGRIVGGLVHRAAWVYHTGRQIPLGNTLGHTCGQKACVNPDHIEEYPSFENADKAGDGEWAQGTCANGHPRSELIRYPSGQLRCRACKRERDARRSYKKVTENTNPQSDNEPDGEGTTTNDSSLIELLEALSGAVYGDVYGDE